MAGKDKPENEPSVDDFEFYLADDIQDLDVDFEDDEPDTEPAQARQPGSPRRSLADRARQPQKKMTAMEALAEAERQAERKKKAALAQKLALEAARRVQAQKQAEEDREAEEAAEWARAAFGGAQGPGKPVAGASAAPVASQLSAAAQAVELPAGAVEIERYNTIPTAIVGPLMASHRVKALQDGDLAKSLAFERVAAAIRDELAEVCALRVFFAEEEWAVWALDGAPIAAFRPADLYLVGLKK